MKRLLLHVGYPKAASTSLQNGLFLELHKQNVINFLGRAFESGYYGIKPNKIAYKKWFKDVVKNNNYDATDPLGRLSESLMNVLSEGLFMMNERYNDHLVGPNILHKYFSSQADQIDVLVVIRKQEDLIPSYFVQNYRKLKKKHFADYLAHNIAHQWTGEAKIFNFYDVARTYSTVFGKNNVHIVLFEDFVLNKGRFGAELGKVMSLDADVIEDHLGESHLNRTRKESGTSVVKRIDHKPVRHRLIRILEKVHLSFAADTLRVRLPAVSEEEKRAIFESFKDSNLRLAEEFAMDKEVMRQYGYF